MYYPIQGGEHYNLTFDLKSNTAGARFYVIATNDVQPTLTGMQVNHLLPANPSNNPNHIISCTTPKEIINPINYIANTNWNTKTYSFQPLQNYKYLLFIPYLDVNTNNLTAKHSNFYVDNLHMTGNLPNTVISMKLNGENDTNSLGIHIFNNEDVILDASRSTDNAHFLRSYIYIRRVPPNGSETDWSSHTVFGLPFSPINISDLYQNDGFAFTAQPGQSTRYKVTYAFNSETLSQWFHKTMFVIVWGGPNFTLGSTINSITISRGLSATLYATGLPQGNYSYQWFEGSNTSTTPIGNPSQLQLSKNYNGQYPYTSEITNINGCTTTKTKIITLRKSNSIDHDTVDNKKNSLIIYPNPVKDQLQIRSELPYETANINVSSLKKEFM